jgi:hypothetical protein
MNEHLPRHLLERLSVDDPRDPVPPEPRAHLASCRHCAERLQALESARAEYMALRPAARFASAVWAQQAVQAAPSARAALPPAKQPVWQRWRWPSAVALAALAILAVRPALAPSERADQIRYKGASAQLQVYVRHAGETRALRTGEALSEGDQLAFTYTLAQPQHLLLFGIDDEGTISRYFPEPTLAPSAVLPAGGARQLPVGIQLDSRRGRERLVALFSATPLEEAHARAALSAELRALRARGAGIAELRELSLPATQFSVWFEKP